MKKKFHCILMSRLIICFVISLGSFIALANEVEAESRFHSIKVVFKSHYTPYPPDTVVIENNFHSDWDVDDEMKLIGPDLWEYECEIPIRDYDCVMQIKAHFKGSNIDPRNTIHTINEATGIDAEYVEINGKKIDSSYIFHRPPDPLGGINTVFGFNVRQDGSTEPHSAYYVLKLDSRLTPDIIHAEKYTAHKSPPSDHPYGVAWMQALYGKNNGDAEVEIDWMYLFCEKNGRVTIKSKDDFTSELDFDGGLYIRYPAFVSTDSNDTLEMPGSIHGGHLILDLASNKNKVWHWWSTEWPRAYVGDHDRCWMEARVLITGNSLVQAGIDYYETGNQTGGEVEAGVSNFFFESQNWQIITVNKPTTMPPTVNKPTLMAPIILLLEGDR